MPRMGRMAMAIVVTLGGAWPLLAQMPRVMQGSGAPRFAPPPSAIIRPGQSLQRNSFNGASFNSRMSEEEFSWGPPSPSRRGGASTPDPWLLQQQRQMRDPSAFWQQQPPWLANSPRANTRQPWPSNMPSSRSSTSSRSHRTSSNIDPQRPDSRDTSSPDHPSRGSSRDSAAGDHESSSGGDSNSSSREDAESDHNEENENEASDIPAPPADIADTGMGSSTVGAANAAGGNGDASAQMSSADAAGSSTDDSSNVGLWSGLGVVIVVLGAVFSVVLYRAMRQGGVGARKRPSPISHLNKRDASSAAGGGIVGMFALGGGKKQKEKMDPPEHEEKRQSGFGEGYTFGGSRPVSVASSYHSEAMSRRDSYLSSSSKAPSRDSIISAGGSVRPGQIDIRNSYVPSVRHSTASSRTARASQLMEDLESPTFEDASFATREMAFQDDDDDEENAPILPKPDRSSMLVYDEVERARRARQSTASAAAIIAAHRAKRNTLLAKQKRTSQVSTASKNANRISAPDVGVSPSSPRSALASRQDGSVRNSTGALARSGSLASVRSVPARLAHRNVNSSVGDSPPQTPKLHEDDEEDELSGLDDLMEEVTQNPKMLSAIDKRVQLPARTSVGPGNWRDLVREIKAIPMDDEEDKRKKAKEDGLSAIEKRKLALTLNKIATKQPSLKQLMSAKRMVMSDDSRASVRVSLPLPPVGIDSKAGASDGERGILSNLQRLAAEDGKRDSVGTDFDFEYEDVKRLRP